MGDSEAGPTPPDELSDALIQQIDELELPELKALHTYIEARVDALRPPIDAEIEANTAGEVLKIETHGASAVVRKHPPDPDTSDANTDITSLYHVRREQQVDGTESLHWTYLGDVQTTTPTRCETCGRTLNEDVDVCPHCGQNESEHPDTED